MDLSLSENAGLTAMLVGVILVDWAPWLPGWVGIILMVLVGALLGAVNGFFVGKMKINPFLITLSTFIMFNWSTYYLSREVIVKVPAASFLVLGGGKIGGIFNSIFVLVGMVFILYITLEHTRFGSHIKAIGGNSEASGMLGISVENTNFWIFTISRSTGRNFWSPLRGLFKMYSQYYSWWGNFFSFCRSYYGWC